MKKIDLESFNKDFHVKLDRYSIWGKAEIDAIYEFLSDDETFSSYSKDQLPQFIFNVEDGSTKNTLYYPIEFLITEIDLPKVIKDKAKDDEVLGKYWREQFKIWFGEIKMSDIPFWMMYITSSGYGLRFVLQSVQHIKNEGEYKEACKQFLKQLEPYGISSEYYDLIIINKGWYFPTYINFFDVRGALFNPVLQGVDLNDLTNREGGNVSNKGGDSERLEQVVNQIEDKHIDITLDYHDWIHIGFALVHSFSEDGRNYFHRISQFHSEYNINNCNKQYDACLRSRGSGISLATLFYIAQKYGIQIPSGIKIEDERFWFFEDRKLKLDYDSYFNLLHSKGIGRLERKYSDDIIFIKVDNSKKQVHQISKDDISVFTFKLIEELNTEPDLKKMINNTFIGDTKVFMAKNYAAIKPISVNFIRDNPESMHFFFQNCFVKVIGDVITTYPYEQMGGYIWTSQIIPMDFFQVSIKEVIKKSEFRTFIKDVSRDMRHYLDNKRFLSLKTTIGYLLHTYKDPAVPKSIVFMDASLSKDTKGRTGKGIVKKGLGFLRNVVIENGKSFDFRSRFNFSQVTVDTDIMFIDDVESRFDFEKLFSVLTEGFVVERKHENKFHIDYEDGPKILITTNYAISGSGESFEGRICEYEFSDYYHLGYTPKDKFGHLLFEQWNQEQWNLFFNFMLNCSKTYLKMGLKQAPFINLHLKKVITKTGFAFVEYLKNNIKPNKKYGKQEVFEDFLAENPTYKSWGRNSFIIHMKEYYKLQQMEVKESHSGKHHYFMVINKRSDLS